MKEVDEDLNAASALYFPNESNLEIKAGNFPAVLIIIHSRLH